MTKKIFISHKVEAMGLTDELIHWIVTDDDTNHEDYIRDIWKNGNLIFIQTQTISSQKAKCQPYNSYETSSQSKMVQMILLFIN